MKIKKTVYLISAFLCLSITVINAQGFSVGDHVLAKKHDYYAGKIVKVFGDYYEVAIFYNGSTFKIIGANLIPLKQNWKVGEWVATDWSNEREFFKVQIVHNEAGRYLCVDWPRLDMIWRDYTTLVPLEYIDVLGKDYDSTYNTTKPKSALIASDQQIVNDQPSDNNNKADNTTKIEQIIKQGDQVKINWQGTWYVGKILKKQDDKYYISYDGYGKSWNEWVGPERIRKENESGSKPEVNNGKVNWKVGDLAWNTFTNEGKYYRVKLIATDGYQWLVMELYSTEVDWKKPKDLFVDKPAQTFFPGK